MRALCVVVRQKSAPTCVVLSAVLCSEIVEQCFRWMSNLLQHLLLWVDYTEQLCEDCCGKANLWKSWRGVETVWRGSTNWVVVAGGVDGEKRKIHLSTIRHGVSTPCCAIFLTVCKRYFFSTYWSCLRCCCWSDDMGVINGHHSFSSHMQEWLWDFITESGL